MNKPQTWIYTHENINDTRITFTPGNDRSELELTFEMDDPDDFQEVIVYGGDGTLEELVHDLYDEIFITNEELDMGEPLTYDVYDGYSLNALAAFQNALAYLLEGVIA